jgi:hypothetical protein
MSFKPDSLKFKDQSNFLVAFLASVISLAAFKDDLSNIHIDLFQHYPSMFNLCMPIVIILLISAYLSALTFVIDSINFYVPLKGLLLIVATAFGIIGLILPIAYIIIWGFSEFLRLFSISKNNLQILASISQLITVTLVLYTSTKLALNYQKDHKQSEAIEILINDSIELFENVQIVNKIKPDDHQQQYLIKYGEVFKFVKDYLDINGYSVKQIDLLKAAKILVKLNVINSNDLQTIRNLNDLRNTYAHGGIERMPSRPINALKQIDEIHEKVLKAYWEIAYDQGNNSN